jgi:hypothetical protein
MARLCFIRSTLPNGFGHRGPNRDQPTQTQMTDALSHALGRPVRYQATAMDSIRARSTATAAMWDYLRSRGYTVDIAAPRAEFPSVAAPSFAQWAQRTFVR